MTARPSLKETDMQATIDIKVGETYALLLPEENGPVVAHFQKELSTGFLRFTRDGTDLEINILTDDFDVMRSNSQAVRLLPEAVKGRGAGDFEDIDPSALLDPDEPKISGTERERRKKAAWRLEEARTLRFYVLRYDEQPAGKGHVGVRRFVDDLYEEAKKAGFAWKPSPGAILRAVDACGSAGERPLSSFFSRRGKHDPGKRWPDCTLELATEMTSAFWAKRQTRKCDVISDFCTKFEAMQAERKLKGQPPLTQPTEETLRLWIKATETYWSYKQKYGDKAAKRRFRGRGRAIEATRPLEYVMMDHTQINAWGMIVDENGTKVLVERPWLTLAIDVYSRMILGAVLTYEHPSVYSALLCLKQVVRRKTWLVKRYGELKGATDGWGKPITLIVDNGWEFVGLSFQVCCEASGIHVIWAPVKTPEFKCYVERIFRTLQELVWHRLDEGIPFKPHEMSQLKLNPMVKAAHTREWLFDKMWEAITTIYHKEDHDGIGMAPARKWREGLARAGRKTLDDVRSLDKILGRSQTCLLTAEGITLRTNRFHDQVTTTALLDRLLRFSKARKQRRGRLQSGTISVLVTWNPGECSAIEVWDFAAKKSVRLPNVDRRYSDGLSWGTHEKILKFVKERNLEFNSDQERHAARSAFSASLRDEVPALKFAQGRTFAPELDAAAPKLPDGNFYEQREIEPTPIAADAIDIPSTLAAAEREGDRIPDRAPRRGGIRATRKSVRTRAGNKARQQNHRQKNHQADRTEELRMAAPTIAPAISTSRLADLAADLD
jgi:putative transposase